MAGLRSPSYTVVRGAHHHPVLQSRRAVSVVTGLALCFMLGGCGIVMPLSSWMSGPAKDEPREAAEVTGSIGKAAEVAAADTDADAVRRALEVASARGVDAPVAWRNDATGNSGTVTASTASRAGNGAPCRDFETTLVSISGVDLHSGRICQGYTGAWEVLRFDRVGG